MIQYTLKGHSFYGYVEIISSDLGKALVVSADYDMEDFKISTKEVKSDFLSEVVEVRCSGE